MFNSHYFWYSQKTSYYYHWVIYIKQSLNYIFKSWTLEYKMSLFTDECACADWKERSSWITEWVTTVHGQAQVHSSWQSQHTDRPTDCSSGRCWTECGDWNTSFDCSQTSMHILLVLLLWMLLVIIYYNLVSKYEKKDIIYYLINKILIFIEWINPNTYVYLTANIYISINRHFIRFI